MAKKRIFDPFILGTVVVLVVIGIVMVYSSSAIVALKKFGDPYYFLRRHIICSLIGFCSMIAVMKIDYRLLRKFTNPLMLISVVALAAVLIPDIGKEMGGARRWIQLGPINFQPAELVKIVICLFLANYLVKKRDSIKDFSDTFLPLLLLLAILTLLIFVQPDLGTAILLVAVSATMMFVAGIRFSYLIGTAFLMSPFVYLAIFKVGYRKRRILAFLDPWKDPSDSGFQIIQSLISFGRGHFLGQGLGEGKQKLLYLPEAHTDFIFSVAGEELGLIGTVAILFVFGVLIFRGLRVSYRSADLYGAYLALSITLMIGIQALFNIFVTLGMLPTKGIPLPFISLGGTSLVVSLTLAGILLNISEHTS